LVLLLLLLAVMLVVVMEMMVKVEVWFSLDMHKACILNIPKRSAASFANNAYSSPTALASSTRAVSISTIAVGRILIAIIQHECCIIKIEHSMLLLLLLL